MAIGQRLKVSGARLDSGNLKFQLIISSFLLLDILVKNKKVIALIVTKQLIKISYDYKNTS